jgi:cell division protein FtsX
MKSLKINLEDNADFVKLSELLIQIKGIKSVEIINEENSESDLKKAVIKSKEQLKSGDYESFVNDLFETFVNKKS